MRKIVIGEVVAALALGLTACGGIDGDSTTVAPSSPVGSAPALGETNARTFVRDRTNVA
ncbi:hypothetical protein [Actinomadura violacea]|uniref:Uncharacterized protein n=1 Tax=Actinomadura violacea TaxID=2819934 RepID=A0ABS3S065_9ACTN|nr:hypothetical protein [Actinomadura violacea]MBO2462406.1 hypothetical protein [Actinomadura violacea]